MPNTTAEDNPKQKFNYNVAMQRLMYVVLVGRDPLCEDDERNANSRARLYSIFLDT